MKRSRNESIQNQGGESVVQDRSINCQISPNIIAELLLPWEDDGRNRGAAFTLIYQDHSTFEPKPISPPEGAKSIALQENESLYMLKIESVRNGVGNELTVEFIGPSNLLANLLWEWQEPAEWETSRHFGGLRFRGHTKYIYECAERKLAPTYINASIEIRLVATKNELDWDRANNMEILVPDRP